MLQPNNINDFLPRVLKEFDWHVKHSGCFSAGEHVRGFTLKNDILPMFNRQWATGTNQHTGEIYKVMKPGLTLASRFLTEDWTLKWFAQLTFGERHGGREEKGMMYLVPTRYQFTAAAFTKVKENLEELGEVITFMWAPRSWTFEAWGAMYRCKNAMPFRDEFDASNWPRKKSKYRSSRYRHNQPCIVMSTAFQDYFRYDYPSSRRGTYSHLSLLFAITLVHEVAHAYWCWLNENPIEPLWSRDEKFNELGFSWERQVIGRVIAPLHYDKSDSEFQLLISVQLIPYTNYSEKCAAIWKLNGANSATLSGTDGHGVERTWPLLDPGQVRGCELFHDGICDNFVAAIHCLPMTWVQAWFREDVWETRRKEWVQNNCYSPPPLVDSFFLIYQREKQLAQISRPLNPLSPVDAAIIRYQEQKKRQGQPMKDLTKGFASIDTGGW